MTSGEDEPPGEEEAARRFRAEADKRTEKLNEARQRINDHPGARLHAQADTLNKSINAIFLANFATLRNLLAVPTKDEGVAVELTQNVRRSLVAEQHHALLVRESHNYLAGAYTLTEHVRALMADKPEDFQQRWGAERDRHFAPDEMRFVGDLRRYIQHYAHLPITRRISVTGANTAASTMTFTTELTVAALSKWDGWTAPARRHLDSRSVIDLLPLFDTHATAVTAANRWLLNELVAMVAPHQAELDDLVVKANAILTGLDYEAAKEFTERRTRQRNSTDQPERPV